MYSLKMASLSFIFSTALKRESLGVWQRNSLKVVREESKVPVVRLCI